MQKLASIFLILIFTAFTIKDTVTFPPIEASNLDGKKVKIPTELQGKMSLLGIAFSPKAENELTTWLQPVYTNFIEEVKGNLFPEESYDIHVFFIPMFSGANKIAAEKFIKTCKTQLDTELQPHLLIYTGETADIRKQLNIKSTDSPHIFVLDENGKVIYQTSGAYTEGKMNKILEIFDKEED